ncbi:hypothetical protein AGRA3207_007160 [Actinomadura graeca]|uniref:Uncharacterized protein n=1 Tax=Actinomadura graeca TaxID=2750812 RepID=A0ABX8R5F6_9ACTN|nr:hypothetical protein [Actinomadura graeca]QXJ25639.1 hypothetical protein AGRA3207_007160 [Actinomadura graeca]
MSEPHITAESSNAVAIGALLAAGLSLSEEEIGRITAGHPVLRAKADALAALDLREDPPADPVAMTLTSALPGEDGHPR